ncbi:alpha/beta hydrolase fold domain-containing protein [Streptomyces griseofuscus]|uniref:alpha/beta hydrolase fold domain-containing protein n=1 Tax=Streptomyces griseofuscus TaxID=146922 RepID=UPI0033F80DB8
MKLTDWLLRGKPNVFVTEERLREALRHNPPDAPVLESLRRSCLVSTGTVDGHEVITLTPRSGPMGTEVIYLHGGVYVRPLVSAHWRIVEDLVEDLIRRTGATFVVPLYGLAPRYTADDAYRFLDTGYERVVQRAGDRPVFLAGDSCGAGLSVGLAIHCRNEGLRPPTGLILFSPWLDVTMTNPGIPALTKLDPMLAPAGFVAAGQDWAGGRSATDPLVGPLHDTLEKLPPITIHQRPRHPPARRREVRRQGTSRRHPRRPARLAHRHSRLRRGGPDPRSPPGPPRCGGPHQAERARLIITGRAEPRA